MTDRPIISRIADYQDRFVRVHTGDAPEPSDPYSGWCVELIRLPGIALMVAVLWLICWVCA